MAVVYFFRVGVLFSIENAKLKNIRYEQGPHLTWKKSLPAASGMENQTTSMVGEQEGPS